MKKNIVTPSSRKKERELLKKNHELPEAEPIEPDDGFDNVPQTLNQKKMAFSANAKQVSIMLELVKDVLQRPPLIGNDQFETMKNAIVVDTSGKILQDLIERVEKIKMGALLGQK